VLGIADVDTRAITRALRQTGCLNGVICTDASKSDDELLQQARSWSILGKDLISEVSGSNSDQRRCLIRTGGGRPLKGFGVCVM
jgi:carbamoylphosphate synthase small subunit